MDPLKVIKENKVAIIPVRLDYVHVVSINEQKKSRVRVKFIPKVIPLIGDDNRVKAIYNLRNCLNTKPLNILKSMSGRHFATKHYKVFKQSKINKKLKKVRYTRIQILAFYIFEDQILKEIKYLKDGSNILYTSKFQDSSFLEKLKSDII